MSSWDRNIDNQVAHLHCQRYVKNCFRVGCIVIWRYWMTLKYSILVHIEQYTCDNACFVILGHYGCPRGLRPKYLPVIDQWGRKCFETILMVKRQSRDMLCLPFSCFCHIFCHTYNTVPRQKIDSSYHYIVLKTLPLGFTKKMGQLNIAFQIWCSVDIFKTKYNKNNVLE